MERTEDTFFALLRAGLWADTDANINFNVLCEQSDYGRANLNDKVDWDKVYQLAEEQSVAGLVLVGIDWFKVHDSRFTIPQEVLLQWIGEVQIIEQQNKAMNDFVAKLIEKLRKEDVYAILVKGQGIAQCYERPLWRSSGDVDLLLSANNYEKAKTLLIPLSEEVQSEDIRKKHQAIIIKGFDVELHGKMPFGLSRKADKVIDAVIEDSLKHGGARVWTHDNSDIYLPNADNDVILVFTHFLRHFFIEGVGLRQICDWCRLLYTYRDSLNYGLLEKRIRKMGLMTEWQVFGKLAVEFLGMPEETMPFYKDSQGMKIKAKRVLSRVMNSGNFGHNNDLSYRSKYTGVRYKMVALWRRLNDFINLTLVFPLDAPRFFVTYVSGKIQ